MKYWVCAFSPAYAPQAKVLENSIAKQVPVYDFEPVYITGEIKAGALARLGRALKLLEQGAEEVVISGADYWLLNDPQFDSYSASCLFCPHFISMPKEIAPAWGAMRAGLINSDLQVWRNTAWNKIFLNDVMTAVAGNPHFSNLFEYEQSWLPYALACCEGELMISNTQGTAYYNLHEREITPATRTLHFSGWNAANPKALTRYGMPRALNWYEQSVVEQYANEVARHT